MERVFSERLEYSPIKDSMFWGFFLRTFDSAISYILWKTNGFLLELITGKQDWRIENCTDTPISKQKLPLSTRTLCPEVA